MRDLNSTSRKRHCSWSAFALSNGVYFLRGHFVDVSDQILILDQYNNKPSYRIGLNVIESIVSSDEDPTLTDNDSGFNNYTSFLD